MSNKIDTLPESADDTRALFPGFYENKAVKQLSRDPLWSVSDPIDKKPLHITALLEGRRNRDGSLTGAIKGDPSAMTDLDTIIERMPAIANHAYRLYAADCGYMVIDIEKTATDETRSRLMTLPWVYAERSLSGTGVHLIVPYPADLFAKYPHAATRPALKARDNTWEVLLDHWVTFTRDVIYDAQPGDLDIYEVLEPMASAVRPPAPKIDFDDIPSPSDISFGETVIALADGDYPHDPEDECDKSHFEYCAAMFYLKKVRKTAEAIGRVYTNEETVALAYALLEKHLESRDKWYSHYIKGTPYIIYTVQCALERLLS